jgi:hypothetical protein
VSATDAIRECSHHSRPAGSPAEELPGSSATSALRPNEASLAPGSSSAASARWSRARAGDAISRWCRGVLHDTRENTFRFVVCRNSIQNATALSVTGEQSPGTAKAELDQGGASRQDARPAGSLFPVSLLASQEIARQVRNHETEVRLKWCGDELDPTRPSKSPGTGIDGRHRKGLFVAGRVRCRKATLNEQGARGFRRRVLNRPQLESLGFGEWCSHQVLAAATARISSSRSERARGEVRVVRACPSGHSQVASVGSRAHTSRGSGPIRSHPSE